jgi:hypothetical protein
VAALTVLAPLCWLGWTSWPDPALDDPADAARAFLADLAAEDLAAAYARTTSEFQACHSLEQFQNLVGQHPEFLEAACLSGSERGRVLMQPCQLDPGSWWCRIQAKEGQASITLKLVAEEGRWRVSSCLVHGRQPAGRP